MRPILTSSHKAAAALRRAETALRNWQDEPDSPRQDVDEMLRKIADIRALVQAHLLAEVDLARDRAESARKASASATPQAEEIMVAEAPETYDHQPRSSE